MSIKELYIDANQEEYDEHLATLDTTNYYFLTNPNCKITLRKSNVIKTITTKQEYDALKPGDMFKAVMVYRFYSFNEYGFTLLNDAESGVIFMGKPQFNKPHFTTDQVVEIGDGFIYNRLGQRVFCASIFAPLADPVIVDPISVTKVNDPNDIMKNKEMYHATFFEFSATVCAFYDLNYHFSDELGNEIKDLTIWHGKINEDLYNGQIINVIACLSNYGEKSELDVRKLTIIKDIEVPTYQNIKEAKAHITAGDAFFINAYSATQAIAIDMNGDAFGIRNSSIPLKNVVNTIKVRYSIGTSEALHKDHIFQYLYYKKETTLPIPEIHYLKCNIPQIIVNDLNMIDSIVEIKAFALYDCIVTTNRIRYTASLIDPNTKMRFYCYFYGTSANADIFKAGDLLTVRGVITSYKGNIQIKPLEMRLAK